MSLQPTDPDLKHELQATLAARRELGPEYDEQFIEKLTARLTEQVRSEIVNAPKPKPHSSALTAEQRVAVAICSLVFGIPLVAIVQSGTAGAVGVAIVFAALVLINIAAGISW